MQTEHESTWAWAHAAHKQEFSVTLHLQQHHEIGPFSYCQWVQVWFSKLLHIEKKNGLLIIPQYYYWWCSQIYKSKVVFLFLPGEVGSDLPVTMLYFEESFGVVCKVPLRSSSNEGLCLLSPEEIYWLWTRCARQDNFSWLVLWGIQQFTCHWKWNALAWVLFCWYKTL